MNTAVLSPSLANTSFMMERAFAWQLLRTISLSSLRYRMGGVMIATDFVERTVLQLVKKFSEVFRTRHFIGAFSTARHLSLS